MERKCGGTDARGKDGRAREKGGRGERERGWVERETAEKGAGRRVAEQNCGLSQTTEDKVE